MRFSDWSSDVCSSDLSVNTQRRHIYALQEFQIVSRCQFSKHVQQITRNGDFSDCGPGCAIFDEEARRAPAVVACYWIDAHADKFGHINAPLDVGHQFSRRLRSEEHTSELQSLMRISYAVFCLKKKNYTNSRPLHSA